jgi:membrane-bound serine protease (ClpP class)
MVIARMLWRTFVMAALMLAGLVVVGPPEGMLAAEKKSSRVVAAIDIKGAIGPATSDYFSRAVKKATAMGASAIIVRMDTPGGLSSAMRAIIQDIISAPVPVITYVTPGGARAASAGTYILYASHVAAMAPGTNLGAATPVPLKSPMSRGNKKPKKDKGKADKGKAHKDEGTDREAQDSSSRKAINDARAYIRSLAQMRGRNVEWAEKAVSEAASLSSADALKANVIDLVADDWRAQLLAVITNPNIAYILLLAGIYGIFFEFYNPNIFSGVIGAICLVLAFYALHVLPVNYAGLGLIILGVVFMIAEVMMPSFGALGFGGIIALVIGSVILIDTDVPGFGLSWAVIGPVVAVSALISFTVFAMAAKAWKLPVVSGREAMVGAQGRVIDWSGKEGRVRVRSEIWRACADQSFATGEEVRVTAMDGLVLVVGPADRTKGKKDGIDV